MKWNKVKNTFMFSKFTREDGKYTIQSEDRKNKAVFVVYDEDNKEIEVFTKLKDAKETYLNK